MPKNITKQDCLYNLIHEYKNKKTQSQEICEEYYDHKSNQDYQTEPIQDSCSTKVITKIQKNCFLDKNYYQKKVQFLIIIFDINWELSII